MSTTINPSDVPLRTTVLPVEWSLADLQHHLGDIPLDRIRLFPPLGLANEDDACAVHDRGGPLCELIDGVSVEKATGSYESVVACLLAGFLFHEAMLREFGVILAGNGPLRLTSGNVRLSSFSFIRWERFPDRKLPRRRVWAMAPDLAVEILSEGNTEREIDRKLRELFESGMQCAWVIDHRRREAKIFSSPENFRTIDDHGLLEAPDILPGFQLRLGELLDRAPLADEA
jgi:hypothetical protein